MFHTSDPLEHSRERGGRSTKLSATTELDTKHKCSINHRTATFAKPLLAAAVLSLCLWSVCLISNMVKSLNIQLLLSSLHITILALSTLKFSYVFQLPYSVHVQLKLMLEEQ